MPPSPGLELCRSDGRTCAACARPAPQGPFCSDCWEAAKAAKAQDGSYSAMLNAWLGALEGRAVASGIPPEEAKRRLADVFFKPKYHWSEEGA